MSAAEPAHMRGPLDRVAAAIELTAAAILAVVTANAFISVIMRYIVGWSIPDSYDFGRLMLGILIFWGIALAGYRGDHITVDLLWNTMPPRLKRAMDLVANLITLACMAIATVMAGDKVLGTYRDNVLTYDLNFPVWIYYFAAWIGLAAAVLMLLIRTLHMIFWPALIEERATPEAIE